MKFYTFYNKPKPVAYKPDTETKFVDQSEADRCSISYNLERFGLSGIASMFEKTKAQFCYADTRVSKNFADLAQTYAEANGYFMQLPAELRKKFNHNPIDFYTEIENNPEKMFKDGYISKDLATKLGVSFPEPVQPVEVQIVEPVQTTEKTVSESA